MLWIFMLWIFMLSDCAGISSPVWKGYSSLVEDTETRTSDTWNFLAQKNNHFCWHCCRTQKHLLRTQGHSWLSILFVGVSKCKWPVIVLHGVFVAILNKFHDRLERRQRLMMYSSDTAKQEMQCEIIDYLTQAAYDSMRSHFTPTIEWCQKVVLRHWATSD